MTSSSHREDARGRDGRTGVDACDDRAEFTAQATDTGARPDLDDDDPDSPGRSPIVGPLCSRAVCD
jgi:hypothetical protein